MNVQLIAVSPSSPSLEFAHLRLERDRAGWEKTVTVSKVAAVEGGAGGMAGALL